MQHRIRISPFGTETLLCILGWFVPVDVGLALRLAGFKWYKGSGWIARRSNTTMAVCIWLESSGITGIQGHKRRGRVHA